MPWLRLSAAQGRGLRESIDGRANQHREIPNGLADCGEGQAVAAMRRYLRAVFRRAEGISARQEEAATQAAAKRRPRRRR
jgi:GntR family transcriptional regulator, rspAB operon transcriptional repressor